MERNYFIFPANYMNFNFEKLFEEACDNNGNVLWGMKPKDPKDINIDDVCYIYYSNLPDGTARIMLRGTIANKNVKDTDGVQCYAIKELESINWDNSKNPHFTREVLRDYGIKMNLNKRRLKDGRIAEGKTVGDEDLRKKLEDCFYKGIGRLKLKDLENELNKKLHCALFKSSINNSQHITFKAKNGLPYLELHHFIHRSQGTNAKDKNGTPKGHPEIIQEIDDPRNIIRLCSNCHNQIHYGQLDAKRKMIEKIYNMNTNKKFFDNVYNKIINKEYQTTLDWLYAIYDASEEK